MMSRSPLGDFPWRDGHGRRVSMLPSYSIPSLLDQGLICHLYPSNTQSFYPSTSLVASLMHLSFNFTHVHYWQASFYLFSSRVKPAQIIKPTHSTTPQSIPYAIASMPKFSYTFSLHSPPHFDNPYTPLFYLFIYLFYFFYLIVLLIFFKRVNGGDYQYHFRRTAVVYTCFSVHCLKLFVPI